MSDPKPNPSHDANGLPLCDQVRCALYDGKRCRAIGFKPDHFCEPALLELIKERKALKTIVGELKQRGAIAQAAAEYPAGRPPPEDLLDRITPAGACHHTRRSLRPDEHGNPVTTCIDCGDEIP